MFTRTMACDPCCPTSATCCGCTCIPDYYRVVIADIVNDSCFDCSAYNGTWDLTLSYSLSGTCIWVSSTFPINCPDATYTGSFQLACDPGGSASFDFVLSGGEIGTISLRKYLSGTWTCEAVNTLTLDGGSDGYCSDFPATIDVTPGPPCEPPTPFLPRKPLGTSKNAIIQSGEPIAGNCGGCGKKEPIRPVKPIRPLIRPDKPTE